MLAERAPLDAIDDANRAVSATKTPHAIDARIAQRRVQIRCTRRIIAREVSGAREGMCRHDGLPSERARVRDRTLDVFASTEWTRRCHKRDARARRERRWGSPRCHRDGLARESRQVHTHDKEKRAIVSFIDARNVDVPVTWVNRGRTDDFGRRSTTWHTRCPTSRSHARRLLAP